MVSKNNRDLYLRRSANKVSKYTIKKLSVGVTSVLVGTAFFIGSTSQANASEQETTQQSDTAVKASDTSSTNDSSRLKVQEASQDQASTSTTSTNDAQDSSADEINQTNTQVENNKQEVATATQAESNNDSVLSNNNVANSAESQAKANEETAATPQDTAGFRRANVDTSARALAANTDNTIADVSSWQELISAMGNSNYQTINVNGAITASSNGNIGSAGHSVTVKGNNGSINFGNNTLVANGGAWNITFEGLNITTGNAKGVIDLSATSGNNTVTFKDVTQSGTSLYGGGGNTDVVIDGTTTSTVDNASAGKANTYNATSREANIHDAKSVTVANGANFTLNRSSIGDGINLPDGSTVKVGDDATFTVNMNTNNATDSARYHNAGIFMQNGGDFVTGRNSVVNMNTSIGQAISMGVNRPADGITDRDRFGGYGTGQSRNAGPSKVELGENSTFNFTGRDGIILGNNSSFISGEYSKVHFQNKGRGVALDLANDSNITISKHSDTLFESNGKTGTSGSYDGYNYIGVNEGGNILIDEFATFRVILTNRGDNPWDDVISLDSRGSNTSASFVSKKGAIVDIRDDNTNFYAELISFPLGAANSKIDIQDPLYVNLQRYSAGGAITGWMNVGGVDINTTNNKYTANLIYMGGNKGTLRIGGTDYVVYQQIKSDGTKQIWLDVNDVTFNKSGFNSKDHYNNGANPDISISGSDLVAGVKANNIKDDNNSPTSGKDAPYYGISTMRASHQIWFPHGTTNQAAGTHKNVIKYVYEDGTEAAPTVTQEVDMTRDMTLAITPDKIKDIQNYASTHTSDETLAYIRNNYAVTEDSGWQIAKGVNTKTAYDAVNTPKIDGYEAQIKSTNANGVTVGSAADTVKANLDIPDEIVKDGQLTDAYKNNGVTGIPQDYETVVVYKKAVQDQSVTIIYQDKSDNNKVLATDTVKGKPGTELGYTTADKITDFENKGYKLVSDGVPKNGTFGNEPETYYVTLEHATTTVTPDPKDPDEVAPQKPGEPINPNDPEGPKWPDEAGEDAVKKPVKATVNYTGAPENPTPNVQNANLTKTVTIDKVTGKVISETPWTPDKDNYDPVKTPVVDGYYADTAEVPGQPVTENDITTTVTYKPLGKIVPKDKDGNEIPGADQPQYNNDPKDPTKGGETPVPTIPGYHLEDPSKTTVTPDPKDPGKDTPVIYVKDEADKYNLVENFVDEAGNKLADSVTKGTDYEEGNDYDVTGDAKVIDGYYLKEVPANAKGTFGSEDVTVNFVYAKVGKIVPQDPEGNPIPNAPTPEYTNDPNDPTKVTPNQPVPEIPGYTPQVPSVTPDKPGEDTPVIYVKNQDQKAVVKYIDDTTGETLEIKDLAGKAGATSDYRTADTIANYVNKGYELVSDNYPANGVVFDDDDKTTQSFEVHLKHGTTPVTPENPGKPGEPINPNDPEGPKWPAGTDKDSVQKPVKETVHYTGAGDKTPADVVQDATWTRELTVDKVTGKIINEGDWKSDKDNYDEVKTPVVEGYVADKATVPSTAVTQDDIEVTVTYTKVGKIVPVDPEGNEIPNAPTPDYKNDPEDPTKVTPNQPVPEIPGFVPEVSTVTPPAPGEDTPVKYVPVTPEAKDQTAKIIYRDETTGQDLSSDSLTGKPGSKIDYSTADKIKELEDKGYVLVNDGFPAGVTFDNDDKVDQTYYVTFKHGTTPVTPENPGKPGEPINPNDPEGPKWPAGTDKDSVQKNVKETVHYVGADDKTPSDVVQDATWTRELTVDKVTGEIVSTGDWKSDKDNYDEVKTPVVEGYVADKATVPSTAVTQDDIEVTVTYNKIGKIVPVDPSGKEIPDAPTPDYKNDPEDPTKVTPNQPVPSIPGYTPEVPSVTPEDPTKDTPVKYTKDEVAKYSLVENFVDEDGKMLAVPVTKGSDYKEGSDYDVSGDAKVIEGYYLKEVPANAKGTFGKDNVTVNFVYAKVGKIVPQDPNGNPIPGAPTPEYTNDPNDPTKVVPNQPVPEIPGFVPQVPTVTPDKPGEDTPVVYVPVTPEETTQNAKVIYRDTTTGQELDSADLTGKSGSKIDYSTADKIKELTDKGYVLVNDGFPTDALFDNDGDVDQTYYVNFKHGEEPVGPNNPHEPGTPINPNDPEGPKWPAKDEYTKEFTSTVHFVDDKGNKVFDDDVQTSTWTRTLYVDTVTGEVKNPNESWKSDKDKYTDVTAPVVDGYYADKDRVAGEVAVQENLEETITYKPLGNIVPVDPEGNKIPGAPTPQYNNDPKDPTKGGKTPVPEIPGYTPQVPSVTPEKPGEDTPVVYVKNDPNKPTVPTQNDQKAKIVYYDVTTDTTLDESDLTGKPGDKINYSTADKIKELTNKGYVLVKDGFPSDAAFDKNDDVDQTYYVTFKHGEAPVGPNNPHEPGTPINPNDPEGPKWPAKDEYTKEFTSTVHFVDNKGNKVKDDDVQTSTWTRTLYVDTVTGEVKNPNESWKSDKDKYAEVTAPVIEDYYADKASVPAKDTVQENIEETITYNPVGKIVPVGPNGEPIPGAPTPEYSNDPNDPTKVTPNQPVPEIPGYTPEVPSVTPDKPGEDTPVKYVKDEAKYSLTVKFVDEAGNELAPQAVKGSDYKKGADYDVSGDAKVIEGYYLKETPANAKGTIGSDNVTVTFVYAKLGNIVPVDPSGTPIPGADTPTYSNDPEDPSKVVPNQPVPVVPGYTPQVPSVTPDKPGEDTPVVYVPVTPEKDKQAARIIYRDTTTGTVIDSVDVYGDPDSKIDYSTADKIKELTNKGYVLVEDGFPAEATFDNDGNTVQTYYVTFKHGEQPVGPDNPHEPGTPINPNDPNGPKWPAKDEYTKQYTSTVQFVDKDGNKLRDDDVQTSTWTRTLIVDSVTGKVKNPNQAWTSDKGKYDDVTAPVIEDYYADKSRVTGKTTVQENLVEKITYTPLGKITPQDPNGDPIPGAPTPGYNNDPKDPTKGGITPVPEIPGYTPRVPSVNPEDPGKDTPVVYEKNEDPKKPDVSNERDQNAKIIFRDVTTDTDLATEKFTGKSGSKITYSTADKIKELLAKGYVLVNDGFPSDAAFDNDNDVDQTYYVTFKHGEAPVGPNDPHEPGTPINPNDPNGPKWPAKDEYTKEFTSTVHFVDKDGNKLRDDDVQTSTWTRTLIVDTVTGKVKNPDAAWTSDKGNYNDVKVPVIEGYYADKANVPGPKATQENIETNVVYNQIGKIVPVDPEGNKIPDAPTPEYTNDPDNPTKVTPNQPVPEIPGFVPEVPTVTPDKPGEDTPVKYVPVTPEATEQKAKVIYRDLTTDTDLASDSLTGKAGSKIDYSTADKIKELLDKGYVLVTDGFPADATFDDNDDVDQVYYVSFKHGEVPVGPDNPHKPGEPINPNDPNGPKWPATDEYSKEFTSTVHFVDDKGNKLRDDDVQTSTWTRTLIVDTVTGEIKNPNASWTPDKGNYKDVKVPVITGYYADKANVPGANTQQKDLEVTVTYREIGKIVPVDPNGNKIPDAPTPQYQNDPEDPTKVTITDTPKVPGYTTSIVSVTPGVPGEDTPVIYTKVETPVEVPITPAQPEVVTPAPAKEAPQAAAELPQMGDANETTMAAVGAAIVAATLGLVGFGVKKKDEKTSKFLSE